MKINAMLWAVVLGCGGAFALAEENLLTLERGGTLVSASVNPERAHQLTNGNVDDLGWHNAGAGLGTPAVFVFELQVPTKLTSVGVRTADDRPGGAAGGAARTVEVEASSEGIDGAYQHLGTIEAGVDSEATLEVMGVKARWLRFTVTANHGHSDWVYLREVMAHGELEPLPENDNRFTGRFDTNLGTLQLQQEAGILTGCYEGGVVLGAVKGGVARINWYDTASEGIGGVALFAMDSRGNLHGVRYSMPESSLWGGPPYGGESQICPPSRPNPVQQALQSNGNVILYGIGFAAEKDTVVPEAEGTMKLLLDALRADPALSVDIQVSTDDEGGKAHNQDLAQRRAASIAVWLTNNGIDASRMNPVGLGEMKPIAENGTSAGRALNRRVEIIRH